MKKIPHTISGYANKTELLLLSLVVTFLLSLTSFTAFAATSCSPGLASVIGIEYVADKCPWEGASYNYYGTDLECVNGTVQRDSMSSGDSYYQGITPQYMQNMILSYAPWYSYRVFRDTPGSRFVLVDQYFARGGGKLNGVSVGNYPIAPTVNYDVFKTVLYKNPNATVPCCLRIMSFTGSPQSIKPSLGETTNLSGAIVSNYPVTWTLTIDNRTITGSGTSVNYTWNGKDDNGRNLPPGTYTAVLTANSNDCTTSAMFGVTVVEPPNTCTLNAPAESSVNVAGGNLTFSQELFSAKGGALSASVSLSYDSLNSHVGALGQGWSHNHEISVQDSGSNSILFRKGDEKRLYILSGGIYTSQTGDYSTLVKNADGTVVVTEKDGLKYIFDANGRINYLTDGNGNATTYVYTDGNLTSVTDAGGRSVTFSYDGNSKLSSVTDPNGNAYTFTYAGDNLTSVNHPDGGLWAYTYDTSGFLLTKKDPNSNVVTYVYDSDHRLISSIDPAGKTRSLSYPVDTSSATRSSTFTEKDGGQSVYTYDISTGTLKSKTDPLGNTSTYTYDGSGNMLTSTEPGSGTTTYTYDTAGNMTSVKDPLNQTTSYTYNNLGQVTSTTDPSERTATNTYDTKGNLIQSIDPLGAKTTYTYDTRGNLTSVTNPLNQTSTFTYDAGNNLVATKDPANMTTAFTYDAMGNVLSQTNVRGKTSRFEYDSRNRLVKATDPQGNVTSYTYDLNGNRITQTDANGRVTRFEYNSQGQLVKTIDALGNAATYTYGANGCSTCGGGGNKLTSVTDADNNTTQYAYDLAGHLIKETDPQGHISTYTYDTAGRPLTRTDGNGKVTTYGHDALNRLTSRSYPDGTSDTFTYNASGNMLTAVNSNISYTMTYDADNRLTGITDSLGRTISYSYDSAGNRTILTAPDGKTITYLYDTVNRLTKLTYGTSPFTFIYNIRTAQNILVNPSGTYSRYGYDPLDRLGYIAVQTATNAVITSYIHTFDKTGNKLTRTEPNKNFTYGYDPLYRLVTTTSSDATRNEAYSYDAVGNRLTGPSTATGYSYAPANELTVKTGATYQYDNNGNLIGKTEGTINWTYIYDFENRLTRVVKNTGTDTTTVSLKYDPFGRRIEKSVISGAGATTTKFLYDGDNILYEYDGSDTITTRYVHNLGIDNPLAMERGGKLYEYHKDTLGSITTITDNGGNVVQAYDYDSFGNIVSTKDPTFVQPYTYTGREWDKETGLYYYRARYYDPMEGRFISKDPIGFRGGDVNLYTMVLNNPINAVDPLGLFCITLPSFATWETFGVSEPRYHYSFLFGDPTGPLGICIWNKIRTEFQRRRYVIKQFCCDNKDCNRKTFCYIKEGSEVTEFRDKEKSESDTTRAWGWFSGDNPKKVGSACCKNPWTGEIVCQ